MSKLRIPYLYAVSLAGILLLGWALWALPLQENLLLVLALMVLACVMQTVSAVSRSSGLSFSINQSVTLGALVLSGLPAMVLVGGISSISIWVINRVMQKDSWRGTATQLAFNTGMICSADFLAGNAFLLAADLLPEMPSVFPVLVPWVIAAVLSDQINFILIAIMLHIQKNVPMVKFWLDQRWVMLTNILIGVIGSGLLVSAVREMGLWGVLIFSLPILAAAYAFRLYVLKSDRQVAMLQQQTQELTHANAKLAEMIKAKNQFVAVLSHDMRTSLGGIRMSVEMLQDPSILLSKQKRSELLHIVSINELTLTNMVNNILESEQLRTDGQLNLRTSRVDLAELIEQVCTSLKTIVEHKHIRLHSFAGNVPVIIHADEHKVRQIVLNLLSNAIKYTPAHGAVFVSANCENDQVILDIEDTGLGIPNEDLPLIFEPYHRVPSHMGKALGTGLGLAIVKRFVEAHSGSVEVESEVGSGSRFTVQFPLITDSKVNSAEYEPAILAPVKVMPKQEILVTLPA